MLNSLVELSGGVILQRGEDAKIKRGAGYLFHCTCVYVLAPLMVALCAQHIAAQDKASAYRQTLLLIQKQIEAGNFDAARVQISAAAKTYPADGGIENLLGVLEIQQGDKTAARQAFTAAVSHDPHLLGACLNLSRLDMETAATNPAARSEALRLDQKVLSAEPGNDEANYQIATILAWEKNYQRSLDHLQQLSAEARAQVGAEALLCEDSAALGHREETDQAATALSSNPDLAEEDANTCLPALRAAHRADLIVTIFTAAAMHHALSAHGLRILGLAQEAEGKLDQARATLEEAFSADSKSVAILEDLSRVAQTSGDYKGALGYVAHARDLKPEDASLPFEFGSICAKMGLLGESRKAIAEALKLDPGNPDYNFGMGTVVSFSQDPSQALPYLMKYRSARPQDPAGTLRLGETYFRAKDMDSATVWLKPALLHPSTASEAHFYLGRIARQQYRLDDATSELKQSLAIRPDQPDALAELGQIAVTKRDYPKASEYLDRAVKLDPENYGANYGLLLLYARTGDPRQDEQSKRFDGIKKEKDEQNRESMRSLEIRPYRSESNPE